MVKSIRYEFFRQLISSVSQLLPLLEIQDTPYNFDLTLTSYLREREQISSPYKTTDLSCAVHFNISSFGEDDRVLIHVRYKKLCVRHHRASYPTNM
jgi:hypothetical protein